MINKFELFAQPTQSTHQRGGEREALYMDKRRRKIQKQLDYILISNNIRTWLNYSRTKGTANPNSENHHKLIRMEIRVKWHHGQHSAELNKHVNFNIKAMRGNKENLLIDPVDPDRERSEETIKEMGGEETKNRQGNEKLWKQLQMTLRKKQQTESQRKKGT